VSTITLFFNNGVYWTNFLTSSAIDASIWINDVNVAFLDALDWAFGLA
jgi:hypothetical protein